MKKQKMENQLKNTFNHVSDGLFNGILADCQKGRMLTDLETSTIQPQTDEVSQDKYAYIQHSLEERRVRAKRKPRIALAAMAAGFVLVLVAIITFQQIQASKVATIITLDLNPSIQLDVNKNDQVLSARALNDEGAEILEDLKLKRADLNVAVLAIMGSMLQVDYLSDDMNTFLISVDNQSAEKSKEVRHLMVTQLETLIANNKLDGMIISQKLTIDDAVSDLAAQYHISTGKAYLLRYIREQYPELPFEVMAAMGIGELADLFTHTIALDADIELHGQIPDAEQQMLLDRASILMMLSERWNLDPANIRSALIQLEDDDRLAYSVEIHENNRVYYAIVDANTGEILSENLDGLDPNPTETTEPTVEPTEQPTETTEKPAETTEPTAEPTETTKPTDKPKETKEPTKSPKKMMLSAAEARRMVVNRFGGIIQKIEYTYDDRSPMYKGEALNEGYKVVFEMNARTSNWEKWDVGNDNSWDSFAYALPDLITMDQAASSVIDKSGQSNTFVQKIDFLWDDKEPLYQGEAFNKGVKYSFEIDAYSGDYQKWDVSTGDDTWTKQYATVQ